MGRKRHIAARSFYNYNEIKNESKCKICGKCLTGSHISNLKRHVKSLHEEMYLAEIKHAQEAVVSEKKAKFTITMGPTELQNACIELVTTEKLPLSFLDSQPFKTLTGQIFAGLNMPPITSIHMKDLIADRYADANEMETMSEDKFENESEMEDSLEYNETTHGSPLLRYETETSREYEVEREQQTEVETLREREERKLTAEEGRKRKADDDPYEGMERESFKMNSAMKFDGDYNFLISLLPIMKNMNGIQKLDFRAQLSNSALNIMRPLPANLCENLDSTPTAKSISRIAPTSVTPEESTTIKTEVLEDSY